MVVDGRSSDACSGSSDGDGISSNSGGGSDGGSGMVFILTVVVG